MITYRELKIWTVNVIYRSNSGISYAGQSIVGFTTEKQAVQYAEKHYAEEEWSVSYETLEDLVNRKSDVYKKWYYEERENCTKLRQEIDLKAEKLAEEKLEKLIKVKSNEISKAIKKVLNDYN